MAYRHNRTQLEKQYDAVQEVVDILLDDMDESGAHDYDDLIWIIIRKELSSWSTEALRDFASDHEEMVKQRTRELNDNM